jgi:hypothetical protein
MALMFAISCVAFITSIVVSMLFVTKSDLAIYNQVSFVGKPLTDGDKLVEELKSYPESNQIIEASVRRIDYISLFGSIAKLLIATASNDDLKRLFALTGAQLISGRFPIDSEPEGIFHECILKSRKVKLGDRIPCDACEGRAAYYKVVGSFKGDFMGGFINKSVNNDWLVVVGKDGQLDALNKRLEDNSKQDARLLTRVRYEEKKDKELAAALFLLHLVVAVVVVSLTLAISAFICVVYLQRGEEFGILFAVGYNRAFIIKLVLKELALLFCCAWVVGYATNCAALWLMNVFLFDCKGQPLFVFTKSGLINTMAIPIFMLICTGVPIFYRLMRWDPIAVIERKD